MKLAREPLSRHAIVASAVAVVDEGGVAALSMRKLAARLGYEVMSLYNHVANKNELLALMVDHVAAEIDEPDLDLAPLQYIRSMAVATHTTLTRHPWVTPLWLRHMPGPTRIRHMNELLKAFDESGLSAEIAHHGFHAVTNHVLGYTLQAMEMDAGLGIMSGDLDEIAAEFLRGFDAEVYPHVVAHVQQHLNGESSSSFEIVLDLIIDGLVRSDQDR